MEKLTEEQLITVLLEITLKEAQLLVIQALDLVQDLQRRNFQHAFNNYEPLLERMQFLRGMLLRALNTSTRPN